MSSGGDRYDRPGVCKGSRVPDWHWFLWRDFMHHARGRDMYRKEVTLEQDEDRGQHQQKNETLTNYETETHNLITVRLFLHGEYNPVEVSHYDLLPTLEVAKLASMAIDELNVISQENTSSHRWPRVNQASTSLRERYRSAFRRATQRGVLQRTVYRVGSVRLLHINQYTKQQHVVQGTSALRLGNTQPGVSLTLEVMALEEEESVRHHT